MGRSFEPKDDCLLYTILVVRKQEETGKELLAFLYASIYPAGILLPTTNLERGLAWGGRKDSEEHLGSSAPLERDVLSFTSKERALIIHSSIHPFIYLTKMPPISPKANLDSLQNLMSIPSQHIMTFQSIIFSGENPTSQRNVSENISGKEETFQEIEINENCKGDLGVMAPK